MLGRVVAGQWGRPHLQNRVGRQVVLTSVAQPMPHDSSDLKGQPLRRVAGGQQLVAEVAPGIVAVFLEDDKWEERAG